MNYSDKLKDGQWQRRRLEILQRDDFKCTVCGSTKLLHIHHNKYTGQPWDAPASDLVTLCDSCHKKEHTKQFTPELKDVEEQIERTQSRLDSETLSESARYSLTMALQIFKQTKEALVNG